MRDAFSIRAIPPHHRIAILLGATGIGLALLAILVWLPLRRELHQLRSELQADRHALRQPSGTNGQIIGSAVVREEAAELGRLTNQWHALHQRIGIAFDPNLLPGDSSSNAGGRIDFKVALFNTRNRLAAKARERQVALPDDLGLPDTLQTEQRAERRLWQLAATAMLMDKCIDHQFAAVEQVHVFDTVARPCSALPGTNYVASPVEFVASGTRDQAVSLLGSSRTNGTFFAVERILIESVDAMQPERISLRMTSSAITFKPIPPPDADPGMFDPELEEGVSP